MTKKTIIEGLLYSVAFFLIVILIGGIGLKYFGKELNKAFLLNLELILGFKWVMIITLMSVIFMIFKSYPTRSRVLGHTFIVGAICALMFVVTHFLLKWTTSINLFNKFLDFLMIMSSTRKDKFNFTNTTTLLGIIFIIYPLLYAVIKTTLDKLVWHNRGFIEEDEEEEMSANQSLN